MGTGDNTTSSALPENPYGGKPGSGQNTVPLGART